MKKNPSISDLFVITDEQRAIIKDMQGKLVMTEDQVANFASSFQAKHLQQLKKLLEGDCSDKTLLLEEMLQAVLKHRHNLAIYLYAGECLLKQENTRLRELTQKQHDTRELETNIRLLENRLHRLKTAYIQASSRKIFVEASLTSLKTDKAIVAQKMVTDMESFTEKVTKLVGLSQKLKELDKCNQVLRTEGEDALAKLAQQFSAEKKL